MTRPAISPGTLAAISRDSTLGELDQRHRGAREARRLFEQDWILQIAFYLGHQWVGVDPAGMLFTGEMTEDRVQLVDNRIRPAVRTNIAKQTKTDPTWIGVPRDASDEEIMRARLRQSLFEHYWRELEGRRRLRLALWYRECTGTGWWKLTFDKTLGDHATVMAQRGGPVLVDRHGRPVMPDRARDVIPEEYRGGLEERKITFGDARLEVKTPFELAVDPLATDEGLATAEYLFEESIVSPAKLARQFGADPDKLTEDATAGLGGGIEARFPALSGYMDRQRDNRGVAGRRGVKVREYWSLPGVDDPRGRHVVWTAAGELLLEEANPYPHLPYVLFNGPPSGRFHADAPIKDLISPQTERNKTKSQIADNAERIGNPARAISEEAINPDRQWLGLPGEEIIYRVITGTAADVPGFVTPPEMPVYVQAQLEENEQSFRVISGQFEVSQGGVPEGVTAASAISQLQEANDTQLGPEIGSMEDALRDAGKQLMWMLRAFAGNDRIARIRGDDEGAWEIESWRGDQIGEATADEVQIGSGMPQSKAAKQAAIQFMLNLFIQNGQAPPPRELRRVLRDFEVGGLEHFFGAMTKDITQVNEEHRRMLRGEELPINTYDNDQLHLEEHQDFQKSSRHQQLARQPGGAAIQQIIEAHTTLHRDRLQQQANDAAAAQIAQTAAESGQPGPDPAMLAGAAAAPAVPEVPAETRPPEGALPSAGVEPAPSIGG